VAAASDDQIAGALRSIGTAPVLDRIFDQMRERFLPQQARGVTAEVRFVVRDEEEEHCYLVDIRDGGCSVRREQAPQARATVDTDLVSFAKLVTGKATGPALFMAGRLRVLGDLVLSMRLLGFFEIPKVG
jgi:putative sterol carrier protein